jgi:HD-like signal output (HDOD) protein
MANSLLIRKPAKPTASRLVAIRQVVLKDLDRVETYPALSETTLRALALVNDPGVSMHEVAGLIRRDAVVAAAILRRANNWTLGGRRVIDNLQQAVLRVGLHECSKILCAIGLRAMYGSTPPPIQERCDAIQRHSLFVANLASEINRVAGLGFSGVEFTAGLLHDIGRVIMTVKCPPHEELYQPEYLQGEAGLGLERDLFGVDHCTVGDHFALHNLLPEPLERVILKHHDPAAESYPSYRLLVALVAFSNRLVNFAQREHTVHHYDLSACPAFALLARGWSPQQQAGFHQSLPVIVVRAFKNTRSMLRAYT